jgi:type IV pilus assembly protein PilE
MRRRGFTLIEMAVAAGITALLVGLTWPTLQGRVMAARRGDATLALERIQIAQERHRALHGLYASELAPLGSGALSSEGLYQVELHAGADATYTAVARARPDGAQAGDTACSEITLSVDQGFATLGPTTRCWNR